MISNVLAFPAPNANVLVSFNLDL